MSSLSGHAGAHSVAVAQRYGVTTMFTLSGGHVFPLYDGAVKANPPLRLVDVRHEQTAVFAAEGIARLTRTPGLAAVTAGPGVTNTVSAVTSAWFNGAPVVVLGGRAPDYLWGKGALQEMDHVPLLAPVTKRAWTEHDVAGVASSVDEAFRLATTPHRGPVFVDFPLEAIYGEATVDLPDGPLFPPTQPGAEDVARISALLATARRPVLVLGSDVWLGGADVAARSCAEALRLPVIVNGQARGVLPGGHSLLVTRARSLAFAEADLVIVAGVPLDFRLRYGSFGPKDAPASVVHVADSPGGIATHCPLAASASGDLSLFFTALTDACGARPVGDMEWLARLRGTARSAAAADVPLLESEADSIHPMRVYGELLRQLDDDAVVIGDGGDFVSFAGRLDRAGLPRPLARPGPLRLPGHRPRLRDRGPPSPSEFPGRPDARRRRSGLVAYGRRHAGPPQPARGNDRRQQLGLGPGEGPYEGCLRLRRSCRLEAGNEIRPGSERSGRRWGTGNQARARSAAP